MRSYVFIAAAVAVALSCAEAARAATVLVSDDFESYGDQTQANFTGFSDLNVIGSVDLLRDNGPVSTPYGSGFVDLDGNAPGAGQLVTDSFAFQAGDIVTFEFDYAGNQLAATDPLFFGFRSPGLFTFKDVTITNGAMVNKTATIVTGSFGTSAAIAAANPWTHVTFTFTAGSAGSLAAYVGTTSTDSRGVLVDNLKLTKGPISAAPEPGAWALMLLGFGGAGGMLRRQRRGPRHALPGWTRR